MARCVPETARPGIEISLGFLLNALFILHRSSFRKATIIPICSFNEKLDVSTNRVFWYNAFKEIETNQEKGLIKPLSKYL